LVTKLYQWLFPAWVFLEPFSVKPPLLSAIHTFCMAVSSWLLDYLASLPFDQSIFLHLIFGCPGAIVVLLRHPVLNTQRDVVLPPEAWFLVRLPPSPWCPTNSFLPPELDEAIQCALGCSMFPNPCTVCVILFVSMPPFFGGPCSCMYLLTVTMGAEKTLTTRHLLKGFILFLLRLPAADAMRVKLFLSCMGAALRLSIG